MGFKKRRIDDFIGLLCSSYEALVGYILRFYNRVVDLGTAEQDIKPCREQLSLQYFQMNDNNLFEGGDYFCHEFQRHHTKQILTSRLRPIALSDSGNNFLLLCKLHTTFPPFLSYSFTGFLKTLMGRAQFSSHQKRSCSCRANFPLGRHGSQLLQFGTTTSNMLCLESDA